MNPREIGDKVFGKGWEKKARARRERENVERVQEIQAKINQEGERGIY